MDCNFAVKVSILIDGELSVEESEKVRKHIDDCQECQKLEKDFLFFRQQIKEPLVVREFELPQILSEKKTPFWKRGISIPVPVLVGLLVLLLGLGVSFVFFRFNQAKSFSTQNIPVKSKESPKKSTLASYDKGERAEIYVVKQ